MTSKLRLVEAGRRRGLMGRHSRDCWDYGRESEGIVIFFARRSNNDELE